MPDNNAGAGASGTTSDAVNSPAAGQVPGGNSSSATTPPAASASGTPSGSEPSSSGGMTLEQALDALAKARQENASNRVDRKRLTELEAAQKAADDAKLSETEKLTKRIAELERTAADTLRSTQERIVRAEIKAAAGAVGIKADLAARLIDYAEIEFADDGEPRNVVKLLEKLAASYPELVQVGQSGQGAGNQPQMPPGTAGGATNPSRTGTNGGAKVPLSWDYINQLATSNTQEYLARHAEIQRWMLDNVSSRPRR